MVLDDGVRGAGGRVGQRLGHAVPQGRGVHQGHALVRRHRLPGVAAVDRHVVPAGDQALADLLDRGLEATVESRHAARAHQGDLHVPHRTRPGRLPLDEAALTSATAASVDQASVVARQAPRVAFVHCRSRGSAAATSMSSVVGGCIRGRPRRTQSRVATIARREIERPLATAAGLDCDGRDVRVRPGDAGRRSRQEALPDDAASLKVQPRRAKRLDDPRASMSRWSGVPTSTSSCQQGLIRRGAMARWSRRRRRPP